MPVDPSFRGSIVLFAVEREIRPFVRLYPDRRRTDGDRWHCAGDQVLVDLLGVGKARARQKLNEILSAGCNPNQIIVAGFAGALSDQSRLGDVIAVSEVIDESGASWSASWPDKRRGRLLTSARMIGDPAEKLRLGAQHEADIVDMESAIVAEICTKRGIPFGCVRTVSDDVTRPLSRQLMSLVESGRVSIRRVAVELIRSPRLIFDLIALAKQTRRAADLLAKELYRLLQPADVANV